MFTTLEDFSTKATRTRGLGDKWFFVFNLLLHLKDEEFALCAYDSVKRAASAEVRAKSFCAEVLTYLNKNIKVSFGRKIDLVK